MANNLNFGFLFSESNGSVDDSFYQNINQGSDPPGEDHDKILNSERTKPNTQVDHSMVLKWRVQAQEQGMRLLSFLREKNRDSASVKSLKRAIDTKRCSVNGRIEIFSSYLLKKGDIVVLDCVEEKAITSLNVLYEDSYLLIVDKPAYLICENRYFAPLIKSRAQLIHRLDKETSGVIMLGKDPLFIKEMIALFREKKVDKEYLALVEGVMSQEQGQVDKPLMRQQAHTPGQVHYGIAKGRAGQSALTLWKIGKDKITLSRSLSSTVRSREIA